MKLDVTAETKASSPQSSAKGLARVQPVFLLATPRSHSALVAAMIGQHPEMFSLPETHLFNAPTAAKWFKMCETATFHMADGLLRTVAELFYGDQTDETILAAEGWLRRRSQYSTGLLFEEFVLKLRDQMVLESSSTLISRPAALRRIIHNFPLARFIHLTQHPRAFGDRLMTSIEDAAKQGPVPFWLLNLASFPSPSASDDGTPHQSPGFDPQRAWYELNSNAKEFLDTLPTNQKKTLRIEDLFADARAVLRGVVGWLGLRTDEEVVEAMMYPERSRFACVGPSRARFGNEGAFLQNPKFEYQPAESCLLDGPLSWMRDEQEFLPKVKALALEFGYR